MNTYSLPLFPLNVVICPGGILPLRIYEARYLDMVKSCLRNDTSFAIVAVLPEGETDPDGNLPFAQIGTAVNIIDADVTTVGLMMIRCLGQRRVKVESCSQKTDGLFVGEVVDIANDLKLPIPEDLQIVSQMLERLLTALPDKAINAENLPQMPFLLDDASWVSNRWVELLDMSILQKQRLMELDSPILRLELIKDFINESNGVE